MAETPHQFNAENITTELKNLSPDEYKKLSSEKKTELINALEEKLKKIKEGDTNYALKAGTEFRTIMANIRRLDIDHEAEAGDIFQETKEALTKLNEVEMNINSDSKEALSTLKAFNAMGEGLEKNKNIINAQKGIRIGQILEEKFPGKGIGELGRDDLTKVASILSEERFDLVYKKGGLIDQASKDPQKALDTYSTFWEAYSQKEGENQKDFYDEGNQDEKVRALQEKNPEFTVEEKDGTITRTHNKYNYTDTWDDEKGWANGGTQDTGEQTDRDSDNNETQDTDSAKSPEQKIIDDPEIPDGEIDKSLISSAGLDENATYTKQDGTLLRNNADGTTEYYDTDNKEWKDNAPREADLAQKRKLEDPASQEYKDNMKKNLGILTNYEGDSRESLELPVGVTFDEDTKTLVNADKTQWWNPESSAWETIDGSQEGSPYNTKQLNDLADAAKNGTNLGDSATMAGEGIEQDGTNIVRKVGDTTERWNTENGGSWEVYTGEVTDKILSDGKTKYTGPLKEGKPEGEGLVKLDSGSTIKGTFISGELNGSALYTIPNGDTFEGTFDKDYKADDNKEYTVTWKAAGVKETGKFKIPGWELNGQGKREKGTAIEEGVFESGILKRGMIRLLDSQGYEVTKSTQEEGGFNTAGNLQGKGVAEYKKNGSIWKREGVFNGTKLDGRITFPNGDIHEGQFDGFNLIGTGRVIHNNGDQFAGDFENGEKIGRGMLTKSNGNSIEATYNKDEIIIDSRIVLRNSSGTQMMDEWDGIGGKNLNKIKAYAESENSKYSQSDGLLGSTPYNQLTLEQFLSEYDDSSGSEDAKKAAKDVLPFVKEFLERNPALKDKKLTEIAALWS